MISGRVSQSLTPKMKAVSSFQTCSVRLMYLSTVRLLIFPVVPHRTSIPRNHRPRTPATTAVRAVPTSLVRWCFSPSCNLTQCVLGGPTRTGERGPGQYATRDVVSVPFGPLRILRSSDISILSSMAGRSFGHHTK